MGINRSQNIFVMVVFFCQIVFDFLSNFNFIINIQIDIKINEFLYMFIIERMKVFNYYNMIRMNFFWWVNYVSFVVINWFIDGFKIFKSFNLFVYEVKIISFWIQGSNFCFFMLFMVQIMIIVQVDNCNEFWFKYICNLV